MTVPDLPPGGVKASPGTPNHQFDSTDLREAHIVRGMGCPPSFALLYPGFWCPSSSRASFTLTSGPTATPSSWRAPA